jgi:hypothetical protein
MPVANFVGLNFGLLTVIGPGGWYTSPRERMRLTLCSCACGNTIEIRTSSLRSGHAISCGCARGGRNRRTHGESRNQFSKNYVPEHVAWAAMIQGCTNPKDRRWKLYGGRGVIVCERWLNSYECFLADVGRRPRPLHSLDRPNKSGNYEPGNVPWATKFEQSIPDNDFLHKRVNDKTHTERASPLSRGS